MIDTQSTYKSFRNLKSTLLVLFVICNSFLAQGQLKGVQYFMKQKSVGVNGLYNGNIIISLFNDPGIFFGNNKVGISIKNSTADILRVSIEFSASSNGGRKETWIAGEYRSTSGVVYGTIINPEETLEGEGNFCQYDFYLDNKKSPWKDDLRINPVHGMEYRIIKIENISENKRKEASLKLEKEKEAQQKNGEANKLKGAQQKKDKAIIQTKQKQNAEKEATKVGIVSNQEKQNTESNISQQKEKNDNDTEIRKKEYADQVIRESNTNIKRDNAIVSETSKTAEDFVGSVLSEKGSTLGVLYGISPANTDFYGITMGNKNKFYNYGSIGASFGKTTQFFASAEFGRFNLLRLIPNSKELNELLSITPSIGYYSIQPNLNGEKPENIGQTFDYDAIQLGASLIINLEASFFVRINYSTDVSYFKGMSGGTVGPVSGKSKPFNGAGYFNLGIGIGFGEK